MILQRKKVSRSRITREKTGGDADYPPLASTGIEDDSPKKKVSKSRITREKTGGMQITLPWQVQV
jgi:ribosomal protein L32